MYVQLDKYHFFDRDCVMRDDPVMLEVGAYEGNLVEQFLASFPGGKAIIYEAESQNFESLQKSIQDDPRITARHAALAGTDGSIVLYKCEARYSHSMFDRSCDGKKIVGTEEVRSVTVQTALRENGLDYLDFFLMNCEGGELAGLQAIVDDEELRNRIGQVCVSFHCNHSRMYEASDRDQLLESLRSWFDITVGNVQYEYYLLTKLKESRHGETV